jgi:creatinine amidohydrolase
MIWNELTAKEIMDAPEKCGGVCLLPMGCIERHGNHLPLGIDYMKGFFFAKMAAELEEAMVFPPYYVGALSDCYFAPGTIVYPLDLALEFLTATCNEIARNGFKKIILVNAHGGNPRLIDYFMMRFCEKDHDYMVYSIPPHFGPRMVAARKKLAEETNSTNGHAGGYETAVSLYLFPEYVKMDDILPREVAATEDRAKPLMKAEIGTPHWWFSRHPHHYGGYGKDATAEYGKLICDATAEDIAEKIRVVKADQTSLEIFKEMRKKGQNLEL